MSQPISEFYKVITYGENIPDSEYYHKNFHAEHNALRHLSPRKNKKRLIHIDIIVIRVNNLGYTIMSKPCLHCLQKMCMIPPILGYKVNKIHYSDSNGNIITTTLSKLCNQDTFHISRFHKN